MHTMEYEEQESLLPGAPRNLGSRRTKSHWHLPTIFSRPVLVTIFSAIACYVIVFNFVLSDSWLSIKGHSGFFGAPTDSGRTNGSTAGADLKDHITVTQWQTTVETEIKYETVTASPQLSPQEMENLVGSPTLAIEGLLEKSLEELRDMIRLTNGYLARDWTLALGWNNVRIFSSWHGILHRLC
jgi:hypothetical protein